MLQGLRPISFCLLLALMILGGCAVPLEPRFERVSEFKMHGKSSEQAPGITLGLDLHNPNRYNIKVISYDLEVFLGGKKVGNAQHSGKQVMRGDATSTIRIELATNLQQAIDGLLGAIGGLLGKQNAVDLKVTGTVVARAKGIQKRVPVDFEKHIELGK